MSLNGKERIGGDFDISKYNVANTSSLGCNCNV